MGHVDPESAWPFSRVNKEFRIVVADLKSSKPAKDITDPEERWRSSIKSRNPAGMILLAMDGVPESSLDSSIWRNICYRGDLDTAKALIALGMKPWSKEDFFEKCVKRGHVHMLQYFLAEQPIIRAEAMEKAIISGNLAVVKFVEHNFWSKWNPEWSWVLDYTPCYDNKDRSWLADNPQSYLSEALVRSLDYFFKDGYQDIFHYLVDRQVLTEVHLGELIFLSAAKGELARMEYLCDFIQRRVHATVESQVKILGRSLCHAADRRVIRFIEDYAAKQLATSNDPAWKMDHIPYTPLDSVALVNFILPACKKLNVEALKHFMQKYNNNNPRIVTKQVTIAMSSSYMTEVDEEEYFAFDCAHNDDPPWIYGLTRKDGTKLFWVKGHLE